MFHLHSGSVGRLSVEEKLKIMIVDDSFVIRRLISRALMKEPSLEVVAQASNGQIALDELARHKIDAIILDIEMPVMDGLTALPKILAMAPNVKVIVASTLSLRNAEISLKALRLGATDYIPKPSQSQNNTNIHHFMEELIRKLKSFLPLKKRKAMPTPQKQRTQATGVQNPSPLKKGRLRPYPLLFNPSAFAIGCSTGGPQALTTLCTLLKTVPFHKPMFIVQHMPPKFTTVLADSLTKALGRPVLEASDGMKVTPSGVYLAPGDYHMTAKKKAHGIILTLNKGDKENFCRPAVDPLLRSLVEVYQNRLLVLMLTGMGSDGLKGCQSVVKAGGCVLAQDEASSVVWGMPGAVAMAGLASDILPLEGLSQKIVFYNKGGYVPKEGKP